MKIADNASIDDNTQGGGEIPPLTWLTPDALPEVQMPVMAEDLQSGVSARSIFLRTAEKAEDVGVRTLIFREIGVKRSASEESFLPNIFFARGTEEEIKSFVYDNVNLPHLRFYYHHTHEGARLIKEPLIVPDYQIEGLKIICASEAEDVIIVPPEIQKFQVGQTVRVIDGVFTGVIGKVARYHGQQRVAIIIEGLLTVCTAYVPSAFLENIV